MQPAWELGLQKAVCLVPSWPQPAEGTFLAPSCRRRCWPWAGSCLLPGAVPYGQGPPLEAVPVETCLSPGCGALPRRGASVLSYFPHRPCKEGNCRKFPGTKCPTCLTVGKGEIPGGLRLGTGCPPGHGGRLLTAGSCISVRSRALLEPHWQESQACGRGKPLASILHAEQAEPARAGGSWADGSWPPALSCSCDPSREPAGPAAPAWGLLQELPLPMGHRG